MSGGICILLTERGFWYCEVVLVDRIFISTSFGVASMLLLWWRCATCIALVLFSSPAICLVAWTSTSGSICILLTERRFWCCEAVLVDWISILTSLGVAGMLPIMVEMRYVRCASVVFLTSRWSGSLE